MSKLPEDIPKEISELIEKAKAQGQAKALEIFEGIEKGISTVITKIDKSIVLEPKDRAIVHEFQQAGHYQKVAEQLVKAERNSIICENRLAKYEGLIAGLKKELAEQDGAEKIITQERLNDANEEYHKWLVKFSYWESCAKNLTTQINELRFGMEIESVLPLPAEIKELEAETQRILREGRELSGEEQGKEETSEEAPGPGKGSQ